ncbi:hypothetical protein HYU14_00170 [Candidatus Woesearchaeota archaeon]|nr:hypothetical protein [Candidatus Woesearchaeota archaeon]
MPEENSASNPAIPKNQAGSPLEDIITSLIKVPDDIFTAAKQAIAFSRHAFNYSMLSATGMASYLLTGAAGPVTGAAMMLGRVIVDWKEGEKTSWDKLYLEGLKGIGLGMLAKLMYQYIIQNIPNKTILGKVGRTWAYNPGFISGIYNPLYLQMTEKMQGRRIQAGEWSNLNWKTFSRISPFHYLTTNYIKGVQEQVTASAGLGLAYRVLAG